MSRPTSIPPLWQPTLVLLVAAQAAFAMAWSVFLLVPKYMSEALGADPATIGRVTGSSYVAAIVSIPLVAWVLGRFGRRTVFAWGAVACAGQAAAFLFIDAVGPLLFAAQMVWGLAFVLSFNAGNAMVVDHAPAPRMGEALGIFGAANVMMTAVASSTVEAVVGHLGWTATLVGASLFAGLAGVLSFWMPRDRVAGSEPTPPRERWLDAALLRLALAEVAWGSAYATITVFYQPFVLSQGVRDVSGFFVGFASAAVGVRVFLGRWIDRWGRRRIACASMLVYAAAAFTLPTMTGATMIVFGAWIGLAHGLLHPALSSLAAEGRPFRHRGGVFAVMTGGFMLGSAIGTVGLGRFVQGASDPSVFVVAGVGLLLGLVFVLPGPLGRPWQRALRPGATA